MTNKTLLVEGVICKGSLQFGSGCGSCSRCKDEIRSVFTRLEAAEAEIAALRGAAVPVAWACRATAERRELYGISDHWTIDTRVLVEGAPKPTVIWYEYQPLFTHPAPPVVVLEKLTVGEVMHRSGFDRQYAEGWCSATDWAINQYKTAGITVKTVDGEEA
ncbi:hypothetical protein [Rouxiella sp. WC2420]|uniref:Uncharacterized protein n=1 Tax=Rouxiella sp. WC2420 TaxID=3234145 RepID=A0AB39VME3_9GAMM